uniref:Replication enhancer n=1 Tax=Bhendi yellow vein mosaic virus TaxID=120168 RepID=A0A088BHE4_9GEMI|nr:replication enhancer protein [Bhendi yellow vein mosaic virus]
MDSRTGAPITAAQAKNGVYIWKGPNPLYFQILHHDNRPFTTNMDIITLEIHFNYNLRKALGIHKCFLTFRIWTTLHPQTGLFLRVFKTQVLKYLNNLGVVSINQTMYVDQYSDIKFNLY